MFDGTDYMEMTGEEYNKLYARYLGRNVDRLILAAGPVEGKRVLDVCAGSGAVALRAKELGASFTMAHDLSSLMLEGLAERGVDEVSSEWHYDTEVFPSDDFSTFDLVVCRQAVNYWWSSKGLVELLEALHIGGHLVFNTFHGDAWTDAAHPTTREYEIDGLHYAETHWRVDDEIHHVQCCEGMPPHCSSFGFFSREDFATTLNDESNHVENWTVERHGPTDIYVVGRA